jgi:sterol desaturase/sphingolipid hydroxylase (fatty acid hydroxylase superfamily)
MSVLILYAIPAFIVLMVVEALWARAARREAAAAAAAAPIRGYALPDTATSLTLGIGNVIIAGFTKAAAYAILVVLYRHRVFTVGTGVAAWVLLFFAEDLCYYAFHRASHEVRFFWAAHVNHHSSQHYNLSTALRQSWTTPFTAPIFWWPLALLGFAPWMIVTQQAISLLYQFWLHTEAIRRLGPLEAILNTPSHHRVHHGSNIEYLDRNHAGILIIWDRLFGTFEPERAPVAYGLTKNLDTFHPVRAAFHEWRALFRDVRSARTLRDALGYAFGPPGWSPDGGFQSTRALQAQRAAAAPPSPPTSPTPR